jgi:hypothetical protein
MLVCFHRPFSNSLDYSVVHTLYTNFCVDKLNLLSAAQRGIDLKMDSTYELHTVTGNIPAFHK